MGRRVRQHFGAEMAEISGIQGIECRSHKVDDIVFNPLILRITQSARPGGEFPCLVVPGTQQHAGGQSLGPETGVQGVIHDPEGALVHQTMADIPLVEHHERIGIFRSAVTDKEAKNFHVGGKGCVGTGSTDSPLRQSGKVLVMDRSVDCAGFFRQASSDKTTKIEGTPLPEFLPKRAIAHDTEDCSAERFW